MEIYCPWTTGHCLAGSQRHGTIVRPLDTVLCSGTTTASPGSCLWQGLFIGVIDTICCPTDSLNMQTRLVFMSALSLWYIYSLLMDIDQLLSLL